MRGRRARDSGFASVLVGARGGEAWAFRDIYRSLAPRVFAFMRVHGAPDPEDLTSEVFVGVLRGIEGFEGDEESFRAWVFTIAHRRLADDRRRRGRRPVTVRLVRAMDWPSAADVAAEVERTLATERVRSLCARLPSGQRDVLLLRLIGRMTVPEVAAAVDRSPAAVKALQRRGLAVLAALLREDAGEVAHTAVATGTGPSATAARPTDGEVAR